MALDRIRVESEVQALRPDFAVLAMVVTGFENGPGDAASEAALADAEAFARSAPGAVHPHIAAWHEAYRAFGAKPQRTAPSVDALWKRARTAGLPRVNWLVDVYNAVSVRHVLPVGGEDLAQYVGDIRLLRATGSETFETTKDGAPANDPPAPGEVVWTDAQGVTCRRWNWRQCTRTRLVESSRDALFLLERLAPLPLDELDAAADTLERLIRTRAPHAALTRVRLGPWS